MSVRGCPVLKRQQRPRDEAMAEMPAESEPLESDVQSAIVDGLVRIGVPKDDIWVHNGATKSGRRHGAAPGFGKGFCDLMLFDAGEVVFAEVKRSEKRSPRPDQTAIHHRLRRAGQTVYTWSSARQAIEDIMELRLARERG